MAVVCQALLNFPRFFGLPSRLQLRETEAAPRCLRKNVISIRTSEFSHPALIPMTGQIRILTLGCIIQFLLETNVMRNIIQHLSSRMNFYTCDICWVLYFTAVYNINNIDARRN